MASRSTAARQAGGRLPAASSASGSNLVLANKAVLTGFVPFARIEGEPQMMFMKSSSTSEGFGESAKETPSDLMTQAITANGMFKFHTLYHPHVCPWMKALNAGGIPGALTLESQKRTDDPKNTTLFEDKYKPTSKVDWKRPKANVEFEPYGSYALFNWEYFVFAPLLIADRAASDQRFDVAQKWFHYVFNPTDNSTGDIELVTGKCCRSSSTMRAAGSRICSSN